MKALIDMTCITTNTDADADAAPDLIRGLIDAIGEVPDQVRDALHLNF